MISKKQVYEEYARLFQAFASASRIELLDLLFQGERHVEQLAEASGMSVANVSQHLHVLRRARLVTSRKAGLRVIYRLSSEEVFGMWESFRSFGESQVLEIREVLRGFLEGRENLEAVTAEQLLERVNRGEVTVIDVRPVQEYEAGHIAGAMSIPVPELEHRLRELPKDREVVAYCRGPYCLQSDEAVKLLARAGFAAKRLEVGLPEWRARQLPVSVGKVA